MFEQLQPLSTSPGAYGFAVLLGLLWGSFANVCIYRWPPTDEHPRGRSVVVPGSHCSACKTPIRWYDNLPIVSYLWLRGRCRACGVAFSPRYLLVEALTGALFGVAWWFTLGTGGMFEAFDVRVLRFVIDAAFVFVMVVIAFIDLDHKLILDKVTYPSMVLFYGASLLLPGRQWWEGLVGAAIGYGVPWLIGEVYFRIRKQEGLGLGDSTLLAVVGALLGWKGVVVALFGGSVAGTLVMIPVLLFARGDAEPVGEGDEAAEAGEAAEASEASGASDDGQDAAAPSLLKTELPFGPFLAAAAVFYVFAEPWIQLHFRLPGG